MYLISAYFDEKTNKTLQKYVDGIAEMTGNSFMKDNNVPPHMTIVGFEARDEAEITEIFERSVKGIRIGNIAIPTIGQMFPYVLFAAPVLNRFLFDLQEDMIRGLQDMPEVILNKYYKTYSWMPHITLGKTLNLEQMKQAFEFMQKSFSPLAGTVVAIGLAKTNPHREIIRINLK